MAARRILLDLLWLLQWHQAASDGDDERALDLFVVSDEQKCVVDSVR